MKITREHLYYAFLIVLLFYIFHLKQCVVYERNRYCALFDWMKKYPGQQPFVGPNDEQGFVEYISEEAVRRTRTQGR